MGGLGGFLGFFVRVFCFPSPPPGRHEGKRFYPLSHVPPGQYISALPFTYGTIGDIVWYIDASVHIIRLTLIYFDLVFTFECKLRAV